MADRPSILDLPTSSPENESRLRASSSGYGRWSKPGRVWKHVGGKCDLTSLASTNGTTDLTGTFRMQLTLVVPVTGLRLVFTNFLNAVAGTYAYTIASAEWYSGVVGAQRVTFNGSNSIVVNPGAVVQTDPINCTLASGAAINFMFYVTVSSGQTFPLNYLHIVGGDTNNLVSGGGSGADITFSSTLGTTVASKAGFGPSAVLGLCPESTTVLCGIGDSKMAGAGEISPNSLMGAFYRAANASGLPWLRIGQGGKKMQDWTDARTWNNVTGVLSLAGVTDFVCNLGVNDIYLAARSLAQLQADALTVWTFLSNYGARVRQVTCEPVTTSSDSWATVANQSYYTNFGPGSTWDNWNLWLLDGAPIISGVATTTGTTASTAIRMGAVGHPLTAVIDILPSVVDATFTAKWKPNYTSDGIHPLLVGHTAEQAVFASHFAGITAI